MFELNLWRHCFPVPVCLWNVLKEKHVCFSCRKIIFETYQPVLYKCNPESLHCCETFHFPRAGTTLPSPCHIPMEGPLWSACHVVELHSKKRCAPKQTGPENWAWLGNFSSSQNDCLNPRRFDSADPDNRRQMNFSIFLAVALSCVWQKKKKNTKPKKQKQNPKPKKFQNSRAAYLDNRHFCVYMPRTITWLSSIGR